MSGGDLVSAWHSLFAGDIDGALVTLQREAPKAMVDTAGAEDVLKLATRIGASGDAARQEACIPLIEAANDTIGRLGVCIADARYAGGHSELGSPRDGVLEVTAQHIGLAWTLHGETHRLVLPLATVTRVGLRYVQVSGSKLPGVLVLGVIGLALDPQDDVTYVLAHVATGECAVFVLKRTDADSVRASIGPVLDVAGVRLVDEPAVPPGARSEDGASPGDTADALEKLANLHTRGLLTTEEFEVAKRKVLE
jgi:hypothetical protein